MTSEIVEALHKKIADSSSLASPLEREGGHRGSRKSDHNQDVKMAANSIMELVFPLGGQKCVEKRLLAEDSFDEDDDDDEGREVKMTLRPPIDPLKKPDRGVRMGLILASDGIDSHAESLLFQTASTAASSERKVLFIAHKKLECLPPPVHRMPRMCSEISHNLRFVYPKDLSELRHYLAALGGAKPAFLPDAVVVSGLQSICGDEGIHSPNVSRALALLREFGSWISSARGGDRKDVLVGLTLQSEPAAAQVRKLHLFADEVWALSSSKMRSAHGAKEEYGGLQMSFLTGQPRPYKITFGQCQCSSSSSTAAATTSQYFPRILTRDGPV